MGALYNKAIVPSTTPPAPGRARHRSDGRSPPRSAARGTCRRGGGPDARESETEEHVSQPFVFQPGVPRATGGGKRFAKKYVNWFI